MENGQAITLDGPQFEQRNCMTNRNAFSVWLGADLMSRPRRTAWRAHISDVVLQMLRAPRDAESPAAKAPATRAAPKTKCAEPAQPTGTRPSQVSRTNRAITVADQREACFVRAVGQVDRSVVIQARRRVLVCAAVSQHLAHHLARTGQLLRMTRRVPLAGRTLDEWIANAAPRLAGRIRKV